MNPAEIKLIPDHSPRYKRSLLYLESQWRQQIPTDTNIHIGYKAAMDPMPYQLDPSKLALQKPRQRILIADNWPDDSETSSKGAMRQAIFRLHNELAAYHDVKVIDARGGTLKFSDDVRITTDAAEMEELFERAKAMPDSEDKIVILKKAFSLYRGRLFMQGDTEIGLFFLLCPILLCCSYFLK